MKHLLHSRLASAALAMVLAPADDSGAAAETVRTQSVTIQGHDFVIPAPYVAGHTLNGNEAGALNQLYAENVRNNCAGRIKAAQKAAEEAGREFSLDTETVGEGEAQVTLRANLQEYADNYEFGARATRAKEPVDPVAKEAWRLAQDVLAKQLAEKGLKRKDLDEGVWDEYVTKIAANEAVQKMAQKRVKEREALGGIDIGDLPTKASDEAEPAEPTDAGDGDNDALQPGDTSEG
jgi:hypothetical protein